MKIKGQQSGAVVELSPEEKFPLAVKDAVSAKAPQGERWWVEDNKIKFKKSAHQTMGPRKDGKAFANNVYTAEGEVLVRLLDEKKDKLRPAKTKNFKIQFKDSLDHLGLPDLSIDSFELT